MLRHVSVLGPSSGSYIVLAKVTLLNNFTIPLGFVAAYRVVLCCQECPVMDVRSVFRCVFTT